MAKYIPMTSTDFPFRLGDATRAFVELDRLEDRVDSLFAHYSESQTARRFRALNSRHLCQQRLWRPLLASEEGTQDGRLRQSGQWRASRPGPH